MNPALKLLALRILSLCAPPPRYDISEWAEAYREIPRGTSPEPGRWHNSRMPYLTEIMQSFTDPNVSETVMMLAKQTGKTECLLNAICYVVHCDPANILIKYSTLDQSKKFSKQKLAPVFRETAVLRRLIKSPRSRDSGNTVLNKQFPGGSMTLIGANSATGTRALSCKWIIQDEIDSDKDNTEGDPVSQADGRAENFPDAVFIKASTPTLKGSSRIEKLYNESDQRSWHVPCPRCNHWQILKWSNVRWTWTDAEGKAESRPEDAVYVCDGCKAELSDFERVRMVLNGKWVAKFPHRRRRGYHLSGLYRIMGKKTKAYRTFLHEFVEKFLIAKGDIKELQFWTNTFLTETWEEHLSKVDTHPIYLRREKYGPALPKGVLLLTCSVDTQGDRLEYLVKGWGLFEESWGIEHGRVLGNPFSPEVWQRLEKEVLEREWDHPLAGKLKIVVTVVDSGGQAEKEGFADPVYRFVRPRQPNEFGPGVYAIKGSSKTDGPPVSNRRPRRGICLKVLNVSIHKDTVHARLKLEQPGPRFMHYPIGFGFDEEFFAQLAAEAKKMVKRRGYMTAEWHKVRDRNEGLDLECYSHGALEILNPDLRAIAAKFAEKEPKPAVPEVKPPALTARPATGKMRRPALVRPSFRPRFR